MDYLNTYYNLVNYSRQKEQKGYLELHHIVPRCVFGEGLLKEDHILNVDQDSNLVYLTGREHFLAHWLLHRAFPKNKKLGLAFWAMTGMISSSQKRDYIPSSRAFAEAREAAVNARKTPILQYDLEGKFIQEHKSLNDACKSIGVVPNAIGQNLNGHTKSAGGYQWRFKTKNYQKRIESYTVSNNGLPVGQYDLNGKLIADFESLLDAERKTGLSEGSIRAAMNRGSKIKGTNYFFVQFDKHQEIPKTLDAYTIPLHGFSIPVVQISSDNKFFIQQFPSVSHAAKFLNKNTGHISSACKGKRETAYGFVWKYLKDYKVKLPPIELEKAQIKKHSKPIAKYNLDGKFIRTYRSASEAARENNDSQSNISSAALGKRNYSGGFQYAYVTNGVIPNMSAANNSNNTPKPVLQIDQLSGQVLSEFKSVGEAANKVGGKQSNISACLNGRKKSAYGYRWTFKN